MRRIKMAEVAIYYLKDPSWMAKTPLNPPVGHSAYSLIEVFRDVFDNPFDGWQDYYFKKLQNIEIGDLPQKLGIRSMMHGDIITLTSRWTGRFRSGAWQCEMVGWREIRPEWWVNGDLPSPAPALVSLDAKSKEQGTPAA